MNASNFLAGLCNGLMGGLLGLASALRVPSLALIANCRWLCSGDTVMYGKLD